MTSVVVNGVTFTNNPCVVHEVTWNGRWFRAGSRALAHLFATQAWLDRHHPGWYIYVIQGAYRTDVEASAGTHDYDGTFDIAIVHRKTGARNWITGRWWMRQLGWASWLRNTGSWARPSSWHLHQNSLGTQAAGCRVGYLVPGQNADYYSGKTGLKYHLPDLSRRPKNIDSTIFNYQRWLEEQEDEMSSPKNWDKDDWVAFDRHVIADGESVVHGKRANGLSLVQMLVRLAAKAGIPAAKKP